MQDNNELSPADYYMGNSLLKGPGVAMNFTPEQVLEIQKCSDDPVYFMENYVSITTLDHGVVKFKMYDFQKDIVNTIHNNRFVLCKIARQSGKSTTTMSYVLHQILFNPAVSIGVLANKQSTAKGLLSMLKTAYENLPKWMQQGVTEWNKHSIQLENGSKVVVASTSSSAARGGSFNCISGDSVITLRDVSTNNVFTCTIEEFDAKMNSSKNEFGCKGKSEKNRTSESKTNIRRNQRKNETICFEESSSRWSSVSEEYEILTPNGYKAFKGIKKSYNQSTIKISTIHKSIICTPNHKIYSNNTFIEASSLSIGDLISTIDGEEAIMSIEINENTDVYDILHVEDVHSFYANGIHVSNCIILDEFAFVQPNLAEDFFSSVFPTISAGTNSKLIIISTPNGLNLFYKLWMESVTGKNSYKRVEAKWNAVPGRDEAFKQTMLTNFAGNKEARWSAEFEVEFLGSDDTLLSPSALGSLVFMEPQKSTPDGLKIYQPPHPDKKYILCVDPSQGLNQDYHGITVVDCSKTPYTVAAVFRNNELSPQLLPNVVNKLARQYNMAYVLIEINDPVGLSVAEHLESEFEYEYLVHVLNLNHKKGQRAELGYGSSKMAKGVKMSYQIKNFGCSRLKDFIENQKLIVNDFDLICELSTFVKVRNTYGASEGNHDDLVMSLVCFCWLTSQEFFKEYINTDLKRRIFEDKIKKLEEDVSLFGYIETGLDETVGSDERDFDAWLANENPRKPPNHYTEDINRSNSEFNW